MRGPEALANVKNKNYETLREYSLRYWEVFQETEDCDMKFALNTFKYGLPRDNNGIYNSFTRVPPYTFDELLSRVNDFIRVDDDEIAAFGYAKQKRGNGEHNGGNGNGKFDKTKRKRKEYYNIVSKDGYKGVNTVFIKLIHKIMFDI